MLKRISAVLHRMVVTWMWENVVQWGCECGGAWSCSWLYSDTWNSCNCMQDRVRTSPRMAYTVMLLWYSYFERNGQKWGGKLKLIGIAIMYKHQFPPPPSFSLYSYFNILTAVYWLWSVHTIEGCWSLVLWPCGLNPAWPYWGGS